MSVTKSSVSKHINKVAKLAGQANKQPRGGDETARTHDKQMSKINSINASRLK